MNKSKPNQVRSWLLLSLCFLLLIISIYVALQQRSQSQTTIRQYNETLTDVGFDTFVTYSETNDQTHFQEHLDYIQERFLYYNQLFDYYHTYDGMTNLKTINDAAGKKAVQVDKELIDCLIQAKTIYSYSEHFDVTQGNLLQVWHTYREEGIAQNNAGKDGSIPSFEELENAYNPACWDAIEIDEDASTVYIKDQNVSIDLGGIAKGYAVEKISEELNAMGVSSAILNAGGNVMLIGEKNGQEPWLVGIQTPNINAIESDNVAVLSLQGSHAVVTSGDYQRYYEVDGTLYSHIIDPLTFYPSHYFRSVTVIADNSTIADGLSTALFTMRYEEGVQLIKQLEKQGIFVQAVWILDESCEDLPKEEALFVKDSYRVYASESLRDSLSKSSE